MPLVNRFVSSKKRYIIKEIKKYWIRWHSVTRLLKALEIFDYLYDY